MNTESRPNTSVAELPAVSINKQSKEVLRAREQAKTLISNNELHRKLGLKSKDEIKIFDLSVEERLLRNEIVKVSGKISNLSSKGIFHFINKEIIKHHKKHIENLYKAKEVVYLQKEEIVRFLSSDGKEHAYNIDLAANGLFRVAQEIHKNALIPETILDDWIIDDWAHAWREKLFGEETRNLFSRRL